MKQTNATNILPHDVRDKVFGKRYHSNEQGKQGEYFEGAEAQCLWLPDLLIFDLSLLSGRGR
jgi:hypothetical protein